jgi:hypothetical protein
VDRYSFTVTDFHHLPPAGLPGAPQLDIVCYSLCVAGVLGLSMYNFAGWQFHANEI